MSRCVFSYENNNDIRIAHAQEVSVINDLTVGGLEFNGVTIKTKLSYPNTRHRYPWICSLRSLGPQPKHLCAVTLLSVPPKPTVVVGAAHCTYLCKNEQETVVRQRTFSFQENILYLTSIRSLRYNYREVFAIIKI